VRKWQSAWRRNPLPFVDLSTRRRPSSQRQALQRTVTGTLAFRDLGLVHGEPAAAVARQAGGCHSPERLPFGRDEKQAKTYDD
jgi:hypothetical protein